MILFIHILIAFVSIAFTAFSIFAPTQQKLHVSYGFIAATLMSGTLLVVTEPAHLLQACISGLVFLSVNLFVLSLAHYRLGAVKIRSNE